MSDVSTLIPRGFVGMDMYYRHDGEIRYKYYANIDKSVWVNPTYSDGLVGVYVRGRNGWNYYEVAEYLKILILLEAA